MTTADEKGDLPVLYFPSAVEWDAWLGSGDGSGVWPRITRRDTGGPGVSYDDALEIALRHGLIDGQKAAGDDVSWLQRFTPRRRHSRWSRRNRDIAQR